MKTLYTAINKIFYAECVINNNNNNNNDYFVTGAVTQPCHYKGALQSTNSPGKKC